MRTDFSASVPPVDAPIAMTLWVDRLRARLASEPLVFPASAVLGAGAHIRTLAAARIFSANCALMSPTEYEAPGLASTSTAPYSIASTAISLLAGVSELTIIVGIG